MTKTELKRKAGKILKPLSKYYHQCHVASIALVKAGIGTRVARGMCPGVGGQHSWVVVGDNVYEPELIIDPTLWSYQDDVKGIFVGDPGQYGHEPHGSGSIWDWGAPDFGRRNPGKANTEVCLIRKRDVLS